MQRSNLFLHCGARNVTREVIDAVPTPTRTPSWVPIPHGQLLTGVQGTLAAPA